jgi:hypothetical protein
VSLSTTYLTADEARDYLRFRTIRALYRWASANAVPKCRRGRSMLFLRRDLDEAVGNTQRVLKPRSSQSQHSERSLHHAGVSQQAIRDVHARQSDESADVTLRNSIVSERA